MSKQVNLKEFEVDVILAVKARVTVKAVDLGEALANGKALLRPRVWTDCVGVKQQKSEAHEFNSTGRALPLDILDTHFEVCGVFDPKAAGTTSL